MRKLFNCLAFCNFFLKAGGSESHSNMMSTYPSPSVDMLPFQQLDKLGDNCCDLDNLKCIELSICAVPLQEFLEEYGEKVEDCTDAINNGCGRIVEDQDCFDALKNDCLNNPLQFVCLGAVDCIDWEHCFDAIDCVDLFFDLQKLPKECNSDIVNLLIDCRNLIPCWLDDWSCFLDMV